MHICVKAQGSFRGWKPLSKRKQSGAQTVAHRIGRDILGGLANQKAEGGRKLLLATKRVGASILLPKSETHKRPDDGGGFEPVFERRLFERIVAWERNQLSQFETLKLFQELVACGLAWKSTGAVSRTASRFIQEGRIKP